MARVSPRPLASECIKHKTLVQWQEDAMYLEEQRQEESFVGVK
jgi:hypothetical protein